jgi:hypothetical protein
MIDLHSHTTASDGTYSPAELVSLAYEKRLRALAITDHDTLRGAFEALRHPDARFVEVVLGVEISTTYTPRRGKPFTTHLLAYFFEQGPDQAFIDWVETCSASRRQRNRRMLELLAEDGIEIEESELLRAGGPQAGRVHLARLLIREGIVGDMEEAFLRYLGEHTRYYVQRTTSSTREAIQRVQAAGGVTSLAHPARTWSPRRAEPEEMVADLASVGLDALEAYHSDQDARTTQELRAMAAAFGLAISGGSDFHGDSKPGLELGSGFRNSLRIPDDVLEGLRERARRQAA